MAIQKYSNLHCCTVPGYCRGGEAERLKRRKRRRRRRRRRRRPVHALTTS
jgi:hypothetical protein